MEILSLLSHGFALPDLGLMIPRTAVGLFFAISGYHKLFNPARHARLVKTLTEDNVPCVAFNQWWVPGWEFVAGTMLTLGLFTTFSAATLAIVCLVACACEAAGKVAKYGPIDMADVLDDYLYLPEVLYLVMLVAIALTGPGAYSLDAVVW